MPVRNNLCCYKPEFQDTICSVCAHLRALFPNSNIFLPFPPAFFFFSPPVIFRDSWKMEEKKSLFSVFVLDLWPLLFQSLALTHTNPASGIAQKHTIQPSCLGPVHNAVWSHSGRFFYVNSSIWCLLLDQLEFFHLCGFQWLAFVGFLVLPLFVN